MRTRARTGASVLLGGLFALWAASRHAHGRRFHQGANCFLRVFPSRRGELFSHRRASAAEACARFAAVPVPLPRCPVTRGEWPGLLVIALFLYTLHACAPDLIARFSDERISGIRRSSTDERLTARANRGWLGVRIAPADLKPCRGKRDQPRNAILPLSIGAIAPSRGNRR